MRAFLFDLDDTLFDHRHSTRVALSVIRRRLVPLGALSMERLEEVHGLVLEEMHREVLTGAMSVDAARVARFRRLLELQGEAARDAEIEAAAQAYRTAYLEARRAVAGAVAVLRRLRPHGAIAIVSNNITAEQTDKIAVCGIRDHVDALVVSEEAGVAKPDPAIFRVALARLGASAEQAVMIGDSWHADITGALAAGIRAVWFNPQRRPCPDRDAIAGEIEAWEPADVVVERILRCAE